jgi:hypothetical protein
LPGTIASQIVQRFGFGVKTVELSVNFQERLRMLARFIRSGMKEEVPMRKLAIGIVAAAGVALSAPAMAQGVWVGAGPVGVGVGVGPGWGYYDGYRDRSYYGPGYRSYAYDYGGYRHCRVIRENINGYIRKVRRCW